MHGNKRYGDNTEEIAWLYCCIVKTLLSEQGIRKSSLHNAWHNQIGKLTQTQEIAECTLHILCLTKAAVHISHARQNAWNAWNIKQCLEVMDYTFQQWARNMFIATLTTERSFIRTSTYVHSASIQTYHIHF